MASGSSMLLLASSQELSFFLCNSSKQALSFEPTTTMRPYSTTLRLRFPGAVRSHNGSSMLLLASSQELSFFLCNSSKQALSFEPTTTMRPYSTTLRLRFPGAVRSHNAHGYSKSSFVWRGTSLSLRNTPENLVLKRGLRSKGFGRTWSCFADPLERTLGETKSRKSEILRKPLSFRRAEVKRTRASNSSESREIHADNIAEAPKTKRRGAKKSQEIQRVGSSSHSDDAPSSSSKSIGKVRKQASTNPPKSSRKKKGEKSSEQKKTNSTEESESDEDNYDDMMDFPYESPGLVCCFGAPQREFMPTVRVSERQMHPDIYSTWKGLQWSPPEFARAPGGPPSNVAIAHVRLGGRAAFMGKVGNDKFGHDLVYTMNMEKVQTRAVKIDPSVKTAISYMKVVCKDGKLSTKTVKERAEYSLQKSDLNLAVLKEAKIFHFNSEVLTSPSMPVALFKAINMSKKSGGLIFFDLNLPLPLWTSSEKTMEVIKEAWNHANIMEVTKQELEFLLDEKYYEKKREYKPQYYAEGYEQTKRRRDYYHYTREEISRLWHDNIKVLFVTDGLFRIHYYTQHFDGTVIGTEDVLITPFTCDRTGSGDALVAGIMRKLVEHPEVYEDQDKLERDLRFAIAAGIISQWTIGAVRGFPTESATQNLKEQVYVPSLW